MILYVVNSDLDVIGIIENTISVIWCNRYFEYGDFEVYAPATDDYINLLQRENILIRESDLTNGMIIKDVEITTDEEKGNTILVKGVCLKSILSRRIIWQQTNVSGNVEACIKQLLNENLISPQDPARQISNFAFRTNGAFTESMRNQYTGKNLYDVILGICQKYNIGYDIKLDLQNKLFVFNLYAGSDRSYGQSINPYVVFSNDFENLLTTTYIENSTDYRNVAKIAGEGEGLHRKTVTVGTATGMERYELWIDARNSSSNAGEITDSEYQQILTDEANETLTEYEVFRSYEGEVETGKNYTYGSDYFLGDVVEIVNEYGIRANTRIIEVIECEDDTGYHTVPTFSTWF